MSTEFPDNGLRQILLVSSNRNSAQLLLPLAQKAQDVAARGDSPQ